MNGYTSWRVLLWGALILPWLSMLLRMWTAFATLPTRERLAHGSLTAPELPSLLEQ